MKELICSHLLTHSSGIVYDAFNPVLTRWRASRGEQASISAGTVIQRGVVPLLFEPGELFEYSSKHSLNDLKTIINLI
jgi:CubicO group peptidase (beta-lactamase class C family)